MNKDAVSGRRDQLDYKGLFPVARHTAKFETRSLQRKPETRNSINKEKANNVTVLTKIFTAPYVHLKIVGAQLEKVLPVNNKKPSGDHRSSGGTKNRMNGQCAQRKRKRNKEKGGTNTVKHT